MLGLPFLFLGHTLSGDFALASEAFKDPQGSFFLFSLVAHAFSPLWSYIHMPFRLRLRIIFLLTVFISTSCKLSFCKLPYLCLTNCYIRILQTIMFSCKLYHNLLQTVMFSCKLYHNLLQAIIFSALGIGVWSHCLGNFSELEERHVDSGPPR